MPITPFSLPHLPAGSPRSGPAIREQFITPNRFSRPGKRILQVKGIVLHYTAANGATAQNIRNAFERLMNQDPDDDKRDRSASAQFAVDDKEIILCLPEHELAYHVGAKKYTDEARLWLGPYPNATTLGIEMCVNRAGEITSATLARTISLTVHLCKKYGLGHTDLWRHFDITRKLCPKPWVENEARWADFVRCVSGPVYQDGIDSPGPSGTMLA